MSTIGFFEKSGNVIEVGNPVPEKHGASEGTVKFVTADELPEWENRGVLLFTIDTGELYAGGGKNVSLTSLSDIFAAKKTDDLPEKGDEGRLYLVGDDERIICYWDGKEYKEIHSGKESAADNHSWLYIVSVERELPTAGNEERIYLVREENRLYRFSVEDGKYIPLCVEAYAEGIDEKLHQLSGELEKKASASDLDKLRPSDKKISVEDLAEDLVEVLDGTAIKKEIRDYVDEKNEILRENLSCKRDSSEKIEEEDLSDALLRKLNESPDVNAVRHEDMRKSGDFDYGEDVGYRINRNVFATHDEVSLKADKTETENLKRELAERADGLKEELLSSFEEGVDSLRDEIASKRDKDEKITEKDFSEEFLARVVNQPLPDMVLREELKGNDDFEYSPETGFTINRSIFATQYEVAGKADIQTVNELERELSAEVKVLQEEIQSMMSDNYVSREAFEELKSIVDSLSRKEEIPEPPETEDDSPYEASVVFLVPKDTSRVTNVNETLGIDWYDADALNGEEDDCSDATMEVRLLGRTSQQSEKILVGDEVDLNALLDEAVAKYYEDGLRIPYDDGIMPNIMANKIHACGGYPIEACDGSTNDIIFKGADLFCCTVFLMRKLKAGKTLGAWPNPEKRTGKAFRVN